MKAIERLLSKRTLSRTAPPAALLLVLLVSCLEDTAVFDWRVDHERLTVAPGATATFKVTIDSKEDINSAVEMSVTDVPATATATFSPAKLASTARTSTLTVETGDTPVGTYTLNLTAKEVGHGSHVNDVLLIISDAGSDPDFSLEVDPASYNYTAGHQAQTFTFYVRPLNGFSGTVDIALSDLGDDLNVATDVTPPSLDFASGGSGKGGTFVLSASPTPPVPAYVDITVTATSGAIEHARTIRIGFLLP